MNNSMAYNSDNLEKIKALSEEIAQQQSKHEGEEKKEIFGCLQKICALLEKPRISKNCIREEITSLMKRISK